MGIYDSGINFSISTEGRKTAIYAFLALVALVLIGGIIYSTLQFTKPVPLEIRFEKNPIKSGEATRIYVKVNNISENDLAGIPLSLIAKEGTEFDIYPLNENFSGTITSLSKGTSREITYYINPVGEILPGTYVLVAKTNIDGTDYEKEAVLTVQE